MNGPDATLITTLIDMLDQGISIFMTPPLVWFVTLGLVAGALGVVRRLIPRKRAR